MTIKILSYWNSGRYTWFNGSKTEKCENKNINLIGEQKISDIRNLKIDKRLFGGSMTTSLGGIGESFFTPIIIILK